MHFYRLLSCFSVLYIRYVDECHCVSERVIMSIARSARSPLACVTVNCVYSKGSSTAHPLLMCAVAPPHTLLQS